MCHFYKLNEDNDPSLSIIPLFNYIANIFENKNKVCPEKNISGPNGHGPTVDFALILIQTSKVFSVTEVKDKDFQQCITQNVVQCESALSNNKITDSEIWYFLEYSLVNGELNFKLSIPVIVVYGLKDMEDRIKSVVSNIAWLIEKIQELEGIKL